MIDEDCYIRIINYFEKSTLTLASFLLRNLMQFSKEAKNKEIIKNCIIIILAYIHEDIPLEYGKIGKNVNQLDDRDKQVFISLLRHEFLSN